MAIHILAIDNYDSFTFTLVDYLRVVGAEVTVRRNDAITAHEALAGPFDGFLISPGPGRPEDAGISVELATGCIDTVRPLLGVCLGHQAIAIACGQKVGLVPPMHGKIATIRHDNTGLFERLPTPFAATRYHSLSVGDPSPPLIANAWSEDNVVMAMRHERAPVHGVQFHPESIASEHGHALLAGFLAFVAAKS
ncbi:MAG: aminodeoxychorismate/anthranilate synthase component II [Sphingomicrobium sp.]